MYAISAWNTSQIETICALKLSVWAIPHQLHVIVKGLVPRKRPAWRSHKERL